MTERMNRVAEQPRQHSRTKASRVHAEADEPSSARGDSDPFAELERLRYVAAAMRAGVWDYWIDTNCLICNDRWYEILGIEPANPIRSIDEFSRHIYPEDVARATNVDLDALSQLIQEGRDYEIEFRIVRPTGEIRWVRSAACVIPGPSGVPHRAVGFIVDVTDDRLPERSRRHQLRATTTSTAARRSTIDRTHRRRQFDQETTALLRGGAEFEKAFADLCSLIDSIIANIAEVTGWSIRTGEGHDIGGHIISGRGRTLQLVGSNAYASTSRYVNVKAMHGDWPIVERGVRHTPYAADAELHLVSRVHLRRTPELGWCWEISNTLHSPADAAGAIVGLFLDSLTRAR